MVCASIIVATLCVVLYWLPKLNAEYNILAFFARRVRTKNGRDVNSIAPTVKGRTIFGNSFDLFRKDEAAVFKYHRDAAKLFGKSYLLYFLGTPWYNIIDPEDAEFFLSHTSLLSKSHLYDFIHPALQKGLLTSTGKKWQTRRNMITPTFSYNVLMQFQKVFIAESKKFVAQFENQAESVVSLSELIPRFTLNNICETAMGINLDGMIDKGDRYRKSIKMIEKCFVKTITNPLHYNSRMYNLLAYNENIPHLKVVHEFSNNIIAKRRILLEEELNERRLNQLPDDDIYVNLKRSFAMLDTLLCAEKDGLIDHDGICEEVKTLMFGGFDTSSIGLVFILMNLSLHEEMQELCYQEILNNVDDLSELDLNQLANLNYLERFIKESFRMYPPVPEIGRQITEDTELPNELILPAGTQINLHVYDIHHNPDYWDKPEEFDPDRFLPENCKVRHKYAYIPFSMGPRNCIAQKYVMMVMKTLICFILKKFRILPITDPKELVLHTGIILRVRNNIKVKLAMRE